MTQSFTHLSMGNYAFSCSQLWTTIPATLRRASRHRTPPTPNSAVAAPTAEWNKTHVHHLLLSLGSDFAEWINKLEILICQKL